MKRQPPSPKFRVVCQECGERQPRATTGWTVTNWMTRHERDKHTSGEATEEQA